MTEPDIRRKFVLTDLAGNSNKIWLIEYWQATSIMKTSWGRVGDNFQTKDKSGMSQWDVDKLIREKENKGYREIQLHVPTVTVVDDAQPVLTDQKAQEFLNFVFREAGERISQFLSVGIDALSQAQIKEGREVLKQIGKLAETKTNMTQNLTDVIPLAQEYFKIIPTQLPRRINPIDTVREIIRDLAEQEDRLNQLEAGLALHTSQVKGQSNANALGIEINTVSETSDEYGAVLWQFRKTINRSVHISGLFAVHIPPERTAWTSENMGKHNVTTLFHGTRNHNVRHILRTGLIIPQHAANGSRFGRGIYFADKAERSYNYTEGRYRKVMFLADVALGTFIKLTGTDSRLTAPPAGYDSVYGAEAYSGLDEYIVYRPSQQTIKYVLLLE